MDCDYDSVNYDYDLEKPGEKTLKMLKNVIKQTQGSEKQNHKGKTK